MPSAYYPNPPLESLPRQRMRNGGAFQNGSYSSGQPWSVKLDRVGDLLSASLALSGTVTTGGTPGTPAARIRNPGQLLGSTVKVLVNGKEELSAHPDLLLLRAQWRRGRTVQLQQTSLTSATLAVGSSTLSFSEQLPLDFVLGQGVVPFHPGVLYGPDAADIEVQGTWGSVSDLMTSPGATQSVASASIVAFKDFARMRRGGPDGRSGLTPSQAAMGFGHYRFSQPGGADVTSTGVASWTKDVPGGRAYCALFLRATAGSSPDASDAPFSGSSSYLRVKRGSDIIYEESLAELKNNTAQGLPTTFDRTGLIVVDFLKAFRSEELGVLSRMLLSPNGQPLTVEIDAVTSTGAHIDLATEEFIDPISSAAQRYGR